MEETGLLPLTDALGRTFLTQGDLKRLEPSKYLNGNLIDFKIEILMEELLSLGKIQLNPNLSPLNPNLSQLNPNLSLTT
jgi:hypothetical protein